MIFQNPGGGTSEVLPFLEDKIRYKRKDSTITISVEDLFSAYATFRGKKNVVIRVKDFFAFSIRFGGEACGT